MHFLIKRIIISKSIIISIDFIIKKIIYQKMLFLIDLNQYKYFLPLVKKLK